ncbi:FIMAH domain-containing protein [Gracilimonas sp.]|uniref:FIMAH domain-containing protein n=1 Tax=Gracilimonas sp. TaxID=1974203 RepID=UPI003D1125B3
MFTSNRKNIYLLFCLLYIVPFCSQAQLRHEVVDGDTIVIFSHPMKDKFEETVSATVSYKDSSLLYSYQVSSSPDSEQNIWYWMVLSEAEIFGISSPVGWKNYKGINPNRYSYSSTSREYRIAPDSPLKNFSFMSHSLPTIQQYFMEGWEQIILDPGNEPDSVENESFFDVAKQGLTIFPRPNSDITNIQDFTDTLQTFRYRSCEELGWITNKGICNSLDVKLRNVERHLERNKPKQAGNVLNAFLNELSAQRGKHITEEGYALLYYNAEYLQQRIKEVD